MTERENVIKTLNDAITAKENYPWARAEMSFDFIRMLIAILKEQEAVEPVLIREGRNKNYNDYVCPRCDNEVVYEQNYCSECGVRFLWERAVK